MYYHVWFGTKYRRHILLGEVGAFVELAFKEIASEKRLPLLESKCYVDHAHLLMYVPDRTSLSKAVQLLKGGSAFRTFRRYRELKLDARTQHLWRDGYGFRPVPRSQLAAVRHYIQTQEERPEAFDARYAVFPAP